MKLKTLLTAYTSYAKVTIIEETGKELDTCQNGLICESLWGDRKVVTFKALAEKYILVIVKEAKQND